MPNLVVVHITGSNNVSGRLTLRDDSVRTWDCSSTGPAIFPCNSGLWYTRYTGVILINPPLDNLGVFVDLVPSTAKVGDQGLLIAGGVFYHWVVIAIGDCPPALLHLSANPVPGRAPAIVGPPVPR